MTAAAPERLRAWRTTGLRLAAVAAAITMLTGCIGTQMRNTTAAIDNPEVGYGSNGTLDPAKLPARARQWLQWIDKAGSFCPEATPLVVAGVIGAESDWEPEANKGKPKKAQGLGQFLPESWQEHGTDADGDGDKDWYSPPDAIVSVGRRLCYLAGVVKDLLKNKEIPGLKGEGNVVDLMIVGYNKGPNIWHRTTWAGRTIHFDDEGIPDARDGNGKTGQQYLKMVEDRITAYEGSAAMGQLPVGDARQRMVAAARSQVGVREWREGSHGNCNPFGYCAPWCAMFASWVWGKGGMTFSSARVIDWYHYGQRHRTLSDDFRRALPGDAVVYSYPNHLYYHVGIIIAAYEDGTLDTIEGNSGDAVTYHRRFDPHSRGGIGFVAPVPGT